MPRISLARHGAYPPPISTHWNSTGLRWRGSTCAVIRSTGAIGGGGVPHRSSVGGCRVAEDPQLDARQAYPLWITSADDLLHVRASPNQGAASDQSSQQPFDLWRVPGRKRLSLGGAGLTLQSEVASQRLRISLARDLGDGEAYACAVPLVPELRGQLEVFKAQALLLQGQAPAEESARPATRASLLHLRALQALDASQAGASHRDIAQALFGLDAVARRWHEDGELRAQVRYLLRRAEGYMRAGYLELVGIRRTAAKRPGDKPAR